MARTLAEAAGVFLAYVAGIGMLVAFNVFSLGMIDAFFTTSVSYVVAILYWPSAVLTFAPLQIGGVLGVPPAGGGPPPKMQSLGPLLLCFPPAFHAGALLAVGAAFSVGGVLPLVLMPLTVIGDAPRLEAALVAKGGRADAAALAPAVPRYAYVHGVALHDSGSVGQAMTILDQAHRRFPADQDLLVALAMFEHQRGRRTIALNYVAPLARLDPQSARIKALRQRIGAPGR